MTNDDDGGWIGGGEPKLFNATPDVLIKIKGLVAAGGRTLGETLRRAGRRGGRARRRLRLLVVKLVKEHVGGLLALADLPAHVLDLFVGRSVPLTGRRLRPPGRSS